MLARGLVAPLRSKMATPSVLPSFFFPCHLEEPYEKGIRTFVIDRGVWRELLVQALDETGLLTPEER